MKFWSRAAGLAGVVAVAAYLLTGAPRLPSFRDIAARSRIDFRNEASHTSHKYLPETMTGGVALFDYNGDGLLDLYFVNGAAIEDPMPSGRIPDKRDPKYWNRLYRNNGGGTFTDVTEAAGVRGAGYGMGVAAGDYDNDGKPDLYVTNLGRNTLYHNNGDGTFTDVTAKAGVSGAGRGASANPSWGMGCAFGDYDNDGRLDLYVANYLDVDINKLGEPGSAPNCTYRGIATFCGPRGLPGGRDVLYHNNGDGTFTDVTEKAGIDAGKNYGLGVVWGDYDKDGREDIYVANDSTPSSLYHNNGDGTFTDVGVEAGVAYSGEGQEQAGMGADFGDYDNDGWPDLIKGNFSDDTNNLYHNNHDGTFNDVAYSAGVGAATWLFTTFGAKFLDYDNDGWKDII
ncbi:MAG: FG-GAP repeat domain-containing protein, partial [Pseudomonadota bacterium]